MVIATGVYLLAVQFSYTRAAYVSVVAAFGGIYIVRYRLIKWVLAVGFAVILLLISDLIRNDKYLDHAPEYRKTITHHRFENLLEATAKGEDISTMERVYRWVAGYHMARTSPWVGFGPGNFYNFYRSYTVTSFKTYVSDNPEHSGIHSYFLMTLVEQGFVGLVIFLLLTAAILLYGERIYHECTDPKRQRLVLAIILSMIVINCILLINDMIETDKVGPFFFMNIAMLVNADLANKRTRIETIEQD
jgi:O-antigen ligase